MYIDVNIHDSGSEFLKELSLERFVLSSSHILDAGQYLMVSSSDLILLVTKQKWTSMYLVHLLLNFLPCVVRKTALILFLKTMFSVILYPWDFLK